MKIVRWTNYLSVRADRHGIWLFFRCFCLSLKSSGRSSGKLSDVQSTDYVNKFSGLDTAFKKNSVTMTMRCRFKCSPFFWIQLFSFQNLSLNFRGFSILSFYKKIGNHPTSNSKSCVTKVEHGNTEMYKICVVSRGSLWNVIFFWGVCLRVVNRRQK